MVARHQAIMSRKNTVGNADTGRALGHGGPTSGTKQSDAGSIYPRAFCWPAWQRAAGLWLSLARKVPSQVLAATIFYDLPQ